MPQEPVATFMNETRLPPAWIMVTYVSGSRTVKALFHPPYRYTGPSTVIA